MIPEAQLSRRRFIELLAMTGALPLVDRASAMLSTHGMDPRTIVPRAPLVVPPHVRPNGLHFVARERRVAIAPGVMARAWSPSDGPVGDVIDVRRGERATITLENQLVEPTILHWHGLRVPEAADGHPRLAIAPGSSYQYAFPVIDRAGTYWYHSHAHHRTGLQSYRGMVGMLIVRDDEEDRLELPHGEFELPMLIQDRRLAADGTLEYEPVMHEQMEGYFGDTPFVNGIRLPEHEVATTTYRVRLVNATSSRILRVALSTGRPMRLIGNDGGLLPQPVTVESIDLATGERADLLVDFGDQPVGSIVMLRSLPFDAPAGGMGMGMGMGMGRGMGAGGMGRGRMGAGGIPQGGAMDLVAFKVQRAVRSAAWRERAFPEIPAVDPARASTTRTFRFESAMMQHNINGRPFAMDRIDEVVRFGTTEIWTFVNESPFPHPVHMHAVQFRVLAREGGRARLMPWEQGWKDTVAVYPGERVSVLATFDQVRGLFLMHCHNMIHEDMGMMLNFSID